MNDYEQIELVAKELGWKWNSETIWTPNDSFYARHPHDIDALYDLLPDCLNDLNVCAKFEAKLDAEKLNYTYAHYLYNVSVPANIQPFRANARQRTESFLKTKYIWR